LKALLISGDWTKELDEHLVARLVGCGMAFQCEGCSNAEEKVLHPILSPLAQTEQLHLIADMLKERMN
jgi:hypothetical protein